MKVKYLGISDPLELTNGKVYDVMAVEGDWYRIIDETDDDYLYPPQCFEIVEPNDGTTPVLTYEECAEQSKRSNAKEEYRKPREVLSHSGFGTSLDTPIGTIDITVDGKPVEFELLRKFDRYSCTGCTTYYLGIPLDWSKKSRKVICSLAPTGHGTCYAASGEWLEDIEFDSEGYILDIAIAANDAGSPEERFEYDVDYAPSGLAVSVRPAAEAMHMVFGVAWIEGANPGEAFSWVSADPGFINEVWSEACDEAQHHCPICGNPISYRSSSRGRGLWCENCNSFAVVTQPIWPTGKDYDTYTLTMCGPIEATKTMLSTINKILGCGFMKAKKILGQDSCQLSEGDAEEMLKIIDILDEAGIPYDIHPHFPYRIIRDDGVSYVWNEYEEGATIGKEGSEGGEIILDAEYRGGSRITVEKTENPPFSITCGIYGMLAHTAFANSEDEAISKAECMMANLAAAVEHPPADEPTWCEAFTEKW